MDIPVHPLLFWEGSTPGSKRRRTIRANSSQEVAEVDDQGSDDGAGDDARPTQSQVQLSGARVEEDHATVKRLLGCSFPDTTSYLFSVALHVDMLRLQLRHERRKGLVRDRLMARTQKTIKVVFSFVDLDKDIP